MGEGLKDCVLNTERDSWNYHFHFLFPSIRGRVVGLGFAAPTKIIQAVRRRAAGDALRMGGMGAWNRGRMFALFERSAVLGGRGTPRRM